MTKKIILSVLASGLLFANASTIVPTKGSDLKITIYNQNKAFINDTREVNVNKGNQKVIFEGIPKNIISESVIPTFTGMKMRLYSQNYIYNLISLNSLIENSIGKEVQYYRNYKRVQDLPELFIGTLLSKSPVLIKDKDTGKILPINSASQIIFTGIPDGMITKPSLVWNVNAEKKGKVNIDLKYLSTGISWKSDYVLNLDKKTLDLNGWITIKNKSGVDYENAKITCLAGEVNRVISQTRGMYKTKSLMMSDSISSGAEEVKEESFSGYHIYKIPFKDTIKNNQNKQINFIDKKEISYLQYGLGQNNYFENYGKQKMVFQNIVEFKNDKENNMGIPLPTGIVRMYKKDSKGETHFIGEDRIKNVPNKEKVKLKIGTMFDVVGEKKISKFNVTKYSRNVETTYEIRNRGKEEVIVKIKERIPTYGKKIRVDTSCSDTCSFEKETAFNRIFTIRLSPEETYNFKSNFDIRY